MSGFTVDVTSEGSGFESEGIPGSPGLDVMLKMQSKMKVAKDKSKSKKHIDIKKAKGEEAWRRGPSIINVVSEKFDHELEVASNRSKIRLQARLEASKTAMVKVQQYKSGRVAATTTTLPPSNRSGGPISLGRPTGPAESAFFASPTPTPALTNTSQATLNLVSPQSVSSSVASPGGASVTPDRTKTATPYIEDTHEDLTTASLDRLEEMKRQYQAEKKSIRFHLRLYIKYKGGSEKIIQMNEQLANLVERETILNKLLEASREKEGDAGDDMDFDF